MSPLPWPVVAALTVAAAAGGVSWWLNGNRWRLADEPGRTRVRLWLSMPACAAAAALVVARLGTPQWWPAAVAGCVLVLAGLAAVVTDLAVRRVLEPVVLSTYGLELAALVAGAAVTGRGAALVEAVAAAAGVWALFFLLALVGGSMGFADVQLAGLVGLVLGWVGWPAAALAAAAMLLTGGVWAVVLLIRGRRGTFAYAPPLLLGALVSVMVLT